MKKLRCLAGTEGVLLSAGLVRGEGRGGEERRGKERKGDRGVPPVVPHSRLWGGFTFTFSSSCPDCHWAVRYMTVILSPPWAEGGEIMNRREAEEVYMLLEEEEEEEEEGFVLRLQDNATKSLFPCGKVACCSAHRQEIHKASAVPVQKYMRLGDSIPWPVFCRRPACQIPTQATNINPTTYCVIQGQVR